ncbi:hypothetical protein [Nonomuraea sp. NPDC049400]|uniref:hypothetical protein n=1 Tax=Nonomuraea sp. NPDC049400 TaxID=3364352 RepID=UPI0037A3AB31
MQHLVGTLDQESAADRRRVQDPDHRVTSPAEAAGIGLVARGLVLDSISGCLQFLRIHWREIENGVKSRLLAAMLPVLVPMWKTVRGLGSDGTSLLGDLGTFDQPCCLEMLSGTINFLLAKLASAPTARPRAHFSRQRPSTADRPDGAIAAC